MPCPFSYSESIPNPIPNPIQKPIPKLQKREETQDILRFIAFYGSVNEPQDILCFLTFLKFRNRFLNRIRNRIRNRFGMHSICIQFARKIKMV